MKTTDAYLVAWKTVNIGQRPITQQVLNEKA